MSSQSTPPKEPDNYILKRTTQEYQRLRVQDRIWQTATRSMLTKSGLNVGQSCLDVGAGPGGCMHLMGQIVGENGRVTGLDIDDDMAAQALNSLRANGPDIFTYRTGDLTKMDHVPGAPFDYVFARLLIHHLADQTAAVSRLWSWVKPGGTLAIMDYDMATCIAYPQSSAAAKTLRLVLDTYNASGRDIRTGSRLPLIFSEAGAGTPDGTDYTGAFSNGATMAPILRQLLVSLRSAILEHGLSDDDGLNALRDAISTEAHPGSTTYSLWPAMASVWKRKKMAPQS